MTLLKFVKAIKEQIYLRAAIVGTSGSGKTWTALSIGSQLAALRGGKLAFIDTEGRSARKYANKFDFDVLDLSKDFSPKTYIDAINLAVTEGYAVIVVDSFTHAWNGQGGVLDIVDKAKLKMGGNGFGAWAQGRPAQNSLAEAILHAPIDIIGTMRSKTEWSIQPDPRTGKDKPVKVGLAPVQSEDFEYEFDLVMYMDMQHQITITKTRCSELDSLEAAPELDFVSGTLYGWLTDGDMPVHPSKLAVNVLASPAGQDDFRTFCTKLSIDKNGGSKPYLEALGCSIKFSEYPGEYEDMKREMQTVYDKLHPSTTPIPAVAPVTPDIPSTDQARNSLGNKPPRRINTAPQVDEDEGKHVPTDEEMDAQLDLAIDKDN